MNLVVLSIVTFALMFGVYFTLTPTEPISMKMMGVFSAIALQTVAAFFVGSHYGRNKNR